MGEQELISIVTDAQSGNSEAFNQLYCAYSNVVYGMALRWTQNPDVACDITQETFIAIIQDIKTLRDPNQFIPWMKMVTRHQCSRHFKKKEIRHECLLDESEDAGNVFETLEEENEELIPDKAMDQEDFKQTVLSFVQSLPIEQKNAIIMKYYDELSVKEIAEVQGVSENTVLSRLNYGRKAVKKVVEEYEQKHHVKLHTISVIAIFKWIYDGTSDVMTVQAAERMAKAISSATGVPMVFSIGGVGSSEGSRPVIVKKGLLSKISGLPIATKCIAGTAIVAIVAMGVTMGVRHDRWNDRQNKDATVYVDDREDLTEEEDENLIPEGCTYTVYETGETLTGGMEFPTEPKPRDKYEDILNGFEYGYRCYGTVERVLTETDGYLVNSFEYDPSYKKVDGWGVMVIDRERESYGEILEKICNEPVVDMMLCFYRCVNMKESPAIPDTITHMRETYGCCWKLKEMPELPTELVDMDGTFSSCSSLRSVTKIPSTVKNMRMAFDQCISLEKIDRIPASVTNLQFAFTGCYALKGNIVIDAMPHEIDGCFKGTKKAIVLRGASNKLEELAATGEGNVTYRKNN
ncbi:MAG: sigma-70 family RNA polymerase sigma factor [Lachnospiraceae bacterium]